MLMWGDSLLSSSKAFEIAQYPVKVVYVLGFCLNIDGKVVLIQWNDSKEPWQRGKCSGIGGSVLVGESPAQAMVREFQEETGISTFSQQWRLMAILTGMDRELLVFMAVADLDMLEFESAEGIARLYASLPENMERSAHWLYMMCTDESAAGFSVSAAL